MSLAGLCILAAILIAALFLAARRMYANVGASGAAVDLSSFSFDPSRYRAMLRLLSEDDLSFISAVTRSPNDRRKARSERKRFFARFLRNLENDFNRLHASARLLLVDATEDRPELARALLSQQLAFRRAMLLTRLRLYAPGIGDAAATAGRLLDLAEALRTAGRQVAVATSAA